jgi:hypothetical protein
VGSPNSRENACFKGLFDRDWLCGDREAQTFALQHRSAVGFVGSGGIEIATPVLRLVPEFRYTRWASASFYNGPPRFGSNRDQVEFLLGLMF